MSKLVTLDKMGAPVVLRRLAKVDRDEARRLYTRVMSSWGQRPDKIRTSIKLTEAEARLIKSLKLPPGLLRSDVVESGWLAIYRHPRKKRLEVRTRTKAKPPKQRIFIISGKRVRLVLVELTRITKGSKKPSKEAVQMARAKKKAVVDDELDELEGLEDLDDLEDEEDLEEPEDEDEEDEEEEPAPKRSRGKTAAKKASPKRRKAAAVEEEEEDEDEEEDEEDEEETPAPRRGRKAASKSADKPAGKAKKGSKTTAKSADKPASKAKSKAKNGSNLPATRELPAGKLGPQEIADMVGGDCEARYVRIYLRDNYDRPEGGRWAFGKQEAARIAKAISKQRS